MKADNDENSRARSVTTALVRSVAKLEAAGAVNSDEVLEGMLKAVGVYALQKLGSPGAVAEVLEEFAAAVRQLPIASGSVQ